MSKLGKIHHRTLKDLVAATLRKAILEAKLKPGQPLVQDQIAKELNISRMPVREALGLLESEGLIINLPYKGSVVARFTRQDIREIYQIRKQLEGYATELAALNITAENMEELDRLMSEMEVCLRTSDPDAYAALDRQFHQLIFQSSGNRRLVKLINQIWKSFPMYLAYSISGRMARSHQEQAKIVEAIRKGDAMLAKSLCREQIETVHTEMAPHFTEETPAESGMN